VARERKILRAEIKTREDSIFFARALISKRLGQANPFTEIKMRKIIEI